LIASTGGDLVLCRIKGRSVYGEVLEVADRRVDFRPLCSAAGWHDASARDIVSHWRKTGRPLSRPKCVSVQSLGPLR
jgi:hypothetical protein